MDWNPATQWWIGAGVLVAVELATGTFYLLMLALGCAAAALTAHAGMSVTAQVVCAALVGGGATALWHRSRLRAPKSAPAESNPDVNLDIGQTVHVATWAEDGTARVHYRGAGWSVRLAQPGEHAPGEYQIVAVHGTELRLAPVKPD
jgi:membrane protein implicated in regulation of membrane protease activity